MSEHDLLTSAGPIAMVTLDEHTVVTEANDAFEALVGPAVHVDPIDAKTVQLDRLLAPESAEVVRRWCRSGSDRDLEAGTLLRGHRRDGLPLVLLAHGIGGAFASSTASVVDAGRPHRRLLLQRAGGPVTWTGSTLPSFPPRTGSDHVLAHDVRGGVRTARTFLGLHQRRLEAAAADARTGASALPSAVGDDRSLPTALRALGSAEELIEQLVRFERVGVDPLVVAPVRLADAVVAATERARTICDALSQHEGQRDLAGGLDVRWDGAADLTLVADADLLVWVLTELLVNARKFGRVPTDAPPDPSISVSARREGQWIDLLVADRGRAIDRRLAPDAFALGRLLQPRGVRPGAGMGLPLCRRIVTRHAGRIAFLEDSLGARGAFAGTLHAAPAADLSASDELEPPRGTTIIELQLLADLSHEAEVGRADARPTDPSGDRG